jgi:hypothetical protein
VANLIPAGAENGGMAELLIGKSVSHAMNRAEEMLFKPIVRKKWMVIGVAAWLVAINEWRAMGAAMELVFQGAWRMVQNPEDFAHAMEVHRIRIFAWLGALTLVLCGIYLLVRWLNCRGQFMLLDAVANDRLVVKESWRKHRTLGNNLLKFRIGWDLVIFNIFLAVFVIVGLLLWPDFRPMLSGMDYHVTWWTRSAVIVGAVGSLSAAVFVMLATFFIDCLLVPVMFVREMPAKRALRESLRLFRENRKAVFKFVLLAIAIEMIQGMTMSAAMIVVVLATCGIGAVFLLTPLLSLLPLYPMATLAVAVFVFTRAYCLSFVEQFGEEYRVAWRTADDTAAVVV